VPTARQWIARAGSATVHEAKGRVGLLKPYMRPGSIPARNRRTAVTVPLQPGDNRMLHVAASKPRGHIVVARITDCTDVISATCRYASARGARGRNRRGRARREDAAR
jgi:4-hydroxy-4-methyl-2-oxoglutarate aldolase